MPDNYEILEWIPGVEVTEETPKFDSFDEALHELIKMRNRLAEDKFTIAGVGYPRYDVSPIYEGGFIYCERGTRDFGQRKIVEILKVGENDESDAAIPHN